MAVKIKVGGGASPQVIPNAKEINDRIQTLAPKRYLHHLCIKKDSSNQTSSNYWYMVGSFSLVSTDTPASVSSNVSSFITKNLPADSPVQFSGYVYNPVQRELYLVSHIEASSTGSQLAVNALRVTMSDSLKIDTSISYLYMSSHGVSWNNFWWSFSEEI